jgi:hypothetical protein
MSTYRAASEDASTHTGGDILPALTADRFDAVDYLNDALPTLSLSTQQSSKTSRTNQLQTASTDTQALLSKLNTRKIRSSTDLTSLTDEILRSGNRLAYEVEILRGDVNNFYDLLNDTLKEDIAQFVRQETAAPTTDESNGESAPATAQKSIDPAFITQLRTLNLIRSRLESVISLFGDAMKWPVPPSDVNPQALISVAAPELGLQVQSTEEDDKAREVERQIRGEIQRLLDSEGGSVGLMAAQKKVEEYRMLSTLWKGTNEEKVRGRFVDSLAKLVEDRRRQLEAAGMQRGQGGSQRSGGGSQGGTQKSEGGRSGLFRGLARLKDEIYLD